MTDNKKLKLKMIYSLVACLMCLFSTVTLTLSWFAKNRDVGGDGMGVVTDNDAMLLGYEYYVAVKQDGGDGYKFNKKEGAEAKLGVYDTLASGYQLYVKIYLKDPETPTVKLQAKTETEYFLGDVITTEETSGTVTTVTTESYPLLPPREGTPSLPDDEGKEHTNALSSIVNFSVLSTTDAQKVGGADTVETPPVGETPSTFVDLNVRNENGEYTLNQSIYVKQDGANNDDVTLIDATYRETECKAFVVCITYDALLVNTVFSANIGNDEMYKEDTSGNYLPIPFVCDFYLQILTDQSA